MRDTLDVLKAVADATRLRALCALRGGELCVCQLTALLELAPSTVSKHLSILRSARLIENRKEGRWIYYRFSKEFRSHSRGKWVEGLLKDLERVELIAADDRRLKTICCENMDSLCRRIFK